MYQITTDESVQRQIDRLPTEALAPFAELRMLLELKPWSGDALNGNNPDGPVRTFAFGQGLGLATYLILEDQRRVDLLQVIWLG
ncbi:hypothetical protein [Actinocrispum wychmicini]|uniref:Uncharacterized protein n=1 Tax=Actinocrispum wychmicini TaxID=1213861 RepID=A0A4R2JSB2_9PSEU|nr:hypothetical protein [Actinocrispum wychmicini]TCO57065.1 hypothetical protein EV192_106542 [Actinocrispum wychmicini]